MNDEISLAAAENGRTPAADPSGGAAATAVEPEVAELLGEALAHHQAGRLDLADAQYRQVLAAASDQADAVHQLGVIAYQLGRYEAALEAIDKAIQHNGNNPLYYNSCGLALFGLERQNEAIAAYDQAVALKPDFAEALLNRGRGEGPRSCRSTWSAPSSGSSCQTGSSGGLGALRKLGTIMTGRSPSEPIISTAAHSCGLPHRVPSAVPMIAFSMSSID